MAEVTARTFADKLSDTASDTAKTGSGHPGHTLFRGCPVSGHFVRPEMGQ